MSHQAHDTKLSWTTHAIAVVYVAQWQKLRFSKFIKLLCGGPTFTAIVSSPNLIKQSILSGSDAAGAQLRVRSAV